MLKTICKVMGIVVVVMVVLMAVCTMLLNSKSVHNRIVKEATSMLSEKFGTHVEIEDASVGIVSQEVNLHGLVIDDQQQRRMLQMDELTANLELWPLLRKKVVVNDLEVKGLDVNIVKPSKAEPANFQFVIDSLRPKGSLPLKAKRLPFLPKITKHMFLIQ